MLWAWSISATILAGLLFCLGYTTTGWAIIGMINGAGAGYLFSNIQYNQISVEYAVSPEAAQTLEALGTEMKDLFYVQACLAAVAIGVVITNESLLRRHRNQWVP